MSEQGSPFLGAETQEQVKLPKITYHESVLKPDCPYKIEVDREGAGALLELAGIPKENLAGITVVVQRKQSHYFLVNERLGDFRLKNKTIRLYGDRWWKEQQKMVKRAERILAKRGEAGDVQASDQETNVDSSTDSVARPHNSFFHRNKFPSLKSGKRLSWYLTVAPPERARAMVEKLTTTYMRHNISSTLQHESKHAADFVDRKREILLSYLPRAGILGLMVAGVVGVNVHAGSVPTETLRVAEELYGDFMIPLSGVMLANLVDPSEIRARRFAKELSHEPKYSIITMTPRNTGLPEGKSDILTHD